ncbi:MAG: LruC domain-containing protein [Candidatus Cloacimonetes bacterium]|nr:LruC domain-containing protein [Candidatus Cloacimonadota bacterium]
MKKLVILVTLSIFMFFAACEQITQNETNDEPININDIQVPEDFTYQTSSAVTVNLIVTDASSNPVQGVVFKIYDNDPDQNGRLISKGGTLEDGSYKTALIVPADCNELTVVSPVDKRVLPIENGELTFEYNDYTKLESPFNDPKGYNPQTKLTNYCISFDGVNDYVNLGDISELNNVSAFTIEGWASQSSNTDPELLMYKWIDVDHDIELSTSTGGINIELGNGSNSYARWSNYSATIPSGTWFHWAVVFEGSGGTNADRLKLYINGNATPVTLSFTGTIPSTSPNLSGYDTFLSASSSSFGGYMDEVRIWSTARTGAQIGTYYNKLIDPSSANLAAYWRMDEGTGATLYDETSNDYDATIHGCSWALFVNGWDSDEDGVTDLNDDYPMDDERAYDNFYPAENTFYTLAFEDMWPRKGDYDFNDIVVDWNYIQITNASNELVDIHGSFKLRAIGAGFHNGFGIQFPFTAPNYYAFNNHGYTHQYVDNGTTNAVVILFQDAFNIMNEPPDNSTWINTVEGEPYVTPAEFEFTYTLSIPLDFSAWPSTDLPPYNPFIYPDDDRLKEIHLADYAPTSKMTGTPYWGTDDDDSNPATDRYFKTSNNLPWAVNIADVWDYPIELSQITWAYLFFADWAESGGTVHTDWYDSSIPENVNANNIYSP